MSIQVKEIAFIYHCVSDVARARRFYEQLLGLKVGLEYEGAPGKWWIEYDIAGVAFAITNVSPPRKKGATLAFEVVGIDSTLAAVRAAGIPLTEQLTEFPRRRSFSVTDPDGNEIMFHELKPANHVPQFDPATAQKVAPYLHEPTGRTVGHHQPTGDGETHLFSPTGFFVATERTRTALQ
jgi:predicted enzyme related to lactoylglutathione lyase